MSKFEVPIVKFSLEKHPNADSLSIAQFNDIVCVVNTEQFVNEEYAVYLPVDSIGDVDHPLISFLQGKRVESRKLRGIISNGCLLPFSQVKEYLKNSVGFSDSSLEKITVVGRNLAPVLKISRWRDLSEFTCKTGNARFLDHPHFQKYTDIERYTNFESVIYPDEWVHISEKLHGSSGRWALIDGEIYIASRNRILFNEETTTIWHFIFKKYNLEQKLKQLSEIMKEPNVAIYGEIVGPGIQDLSYGQTEPSLFVYDISVNNMYVDPEKCKSLCQAVDLPEVPVLKIGKFNAGDLHLRLGNSYLGNNHVREGVVIKPLVPRYDQSLGRVILKVISEEYLNRKGAKDKINP
jgi:RNA ligase (TIGR02306 family)